MNRFLLTTALVMFGSVFTGCIEIRPNPTGGPGGLRVNNVSASGQNTPSKEIPIRLWVLTSEQIKTPPATKAQAERLDSFVIPLFRTFTFNRPAGTYYLVASNEAYYQTLKDDDKFEAGVSFSLKEFKVEDKLIAVQVANSNTATRLPTITHRP